VNKIVLDVNNELYSVEYTVEGMRYTGNVYPANSYIENGIEKVCYTSKKDGSLIDTLSEDVRISFEFSFVWRGIWEGRIYFKDDEYWSEELMEMANVWEKIQTLFKEEIRKENPSVLFED
jgi:hypothetical protein